MGLTQRRAGGGDGRWTWAKILHSSSHHVVMRDKGQRGTQAAEGSSSFLPGTLYPSWEQQMTSTCSEHSERLGTSEV